MADLTTRLSKRVARDFPEPGSAQEVARIVGETSDSERIQAAIVLWGQGDLVRLLYAKRLADEDWRDVLMQADLADDDWRDKLDAELGTSG
ncbi:hypothetical protein M6D93_06410 [Jatrophihabitans telluris]|uniref:Uncharacterized protein n=1 Tax=Jatrophihabitans telluris TaxID=2038343 RepID=A0ABY4R2C2_9ACTN|nr:hypothetical protein [Jatrophihabitans telluris]UQX89632.1 hypothetical protein M6D93_06410 [Jatrophihabitans telluris]